MTRLLFAGRAAFRPLKLSLDVHSARSACLHSEGLTSDSCKQGPNETNAPRNEPKTERSAPEAHRIGARRKTADARDLPEQNRYAMATADTTTSSEVAEHKRTVDGSFLNKLKALVERLRLDNANLKRALDLERGEVRALKARHDSALRHLKTECRKKEELLEKQLRTAPKQEKTEDGQVGCSKMVELKRLTAEVQSLKSANRGLQEKLKSLTG
ncbi:unnamed protein product, partial [Iphiclides podalirius]